MAQSALELLQSPHETAKLSFGCPQLDCALGGGIPVHGVTEVCGEAGCGKTQLCLQLALQAQLPAALGGFGGQSVYLNCGEGAFPIARLKQMASACAAHPRAQHLGLTEHSLMQGVHIQRVDDVDSQVEVVTQQLPKLITANQIRLVVIDSVAATFRNDDKFTEEAAAMSNGARKRRGVQARAAISRAEELFQLAAALKRLSFHYHVPVVVVNQASAGSDDNRGHVAPDAMQLLPHVTTRPALGLSWSSCVNRRIMLARTERGNDDALGAASTVQQLPVRPQLCRWRRDAVLMFSPAAPCRSVEFDILDCGVRAADSDGQREAPLPLPRRCSEQPRENRRHDVYSTIASPVWGMSTQIRPEHGAVAAMARSGAW